MAFNFTIGTTELLLYHQLKIGSTIQMKVGLQPRLYYMDPKGFYYGLGFLVMCWDGPVEVSRQISDNENVWASVCGLV